MKENSRSLCNTLAINLKPSETLAVKAKANELRAQGRKIIDLSTGEPDIDTPDFIKAAALEAQAQGFTKYTDVAGIKDLREALAQKFKNENKIACDLNSVIVCNGGKQALHQALMVLLEPGDEVLIPAPYWVSYIPMVELAGGRARIVQTRAENAYRLTPEELKLALSPQTRAIIFNSPSNPCGTAYTAREYRALGEVLLNHDCLVISDEVYEKVTYADFEFVSFVEAMPELAERTITVNSFSKSYSMTGWRVGYACGPKAIISAMARFQSQTTSNINSIAQYAALAALRGPQDFIKEMNLSFSRRIEACLKTLNAIEGLKVNCIPRGAFYLFISFADLAKKISGPQAAHLNSSQQFVAYLLEQTGLAAVPGEAFGDSKAFRISVAAADAQVSAGAQAIVDAVKSFGK